MYCLYTHENVDIFGWPLNPLYLLIDNTTIERALKNNFLCLTLDENLNWKGRIDKISNKISKSIGILNKLKHFIPIKIKILIYNSLILSYLNYCILAQGYQCNRLIKLHKKTVRIVSLSKFNQHTKPILKELKLLKIKGILQLQELKLFYKYKKNKLPSYLQNMPLQPNSDIHKYETWTRHHIYQPKTKHEYSKHCIRFHIPKTINNSILDKINTHILKGFSGYMKTCFPLAYQKTYTIENYYVCN